MLKVEEIRTFYGDSAVLHGVSFAVEPRACVALMGRNGVGKTTTLRSIVGLSPPRSGRIWFGDERIDRLKTYEIIRRGVAYVPEDRGIFSTLTVEEHLGLARAVAGRAGKARGARDGRLDELFELFPNLAQRRRHYGSQLSGGEQQMLAIARALTLEPSLLILDEPSEGLAPVIIEGLERSLQAIKRTGTTILLVEQNYMLATSLADTVHVMSQGTIHFTGTSAELERDEEVKARLLGI